MYFVPVYQCTSTHPQGGVPLVPAWPTPVPEPKRDTELIEERVFSPVFCFAPLICSKNEVLCRFEPFDVFLAEFIPFLIMKARKLYSSQL